MCVEAGGCGIELEDVIGWYLPSVTTPTFFPFMYKVLPLILMTLLSVRELIENRPSFNSRDSISLSPFGRSGVIRIPGRSASFALEDNIRVTSLALDNLTITGRFEPSLKRPSL